MRHPRLSYITRFSLCPFVVCATLITSSVAGLCADKKPDPHLFILSGQSNMTRTLATSFRQCVEQELGKDHVLVSMTGHPGQPIKNWHKDWQPPQGMKDPKPENNGKLYDVLLRTLKRTLKDRKPASVTFVWMQGESDAGNQWAAVYEKSFLALLERLKSDLGVRQINFVLGRINDFWLEKPDGKKIRDIIVKLGEEHSHGAWIDTDDLNRGVNPWGGYSFEDGHYPPAGYVVMGQRFARKACQLLNPNKKLNPILYKEHFIDTHMDVNSHAAAGKKINGSKPHSEHNGGGTGLQTLLDGKFGATNHTDKNWIGFAPTDQPVQLVIDLGEPMAIDQLGVNMLLSSEAKAEFPTQLVYSTSEDGKAFNVNNKRYNTIKFYNSKKLRAMRAKGIQPQPVLLLTGQGATTARYLRIEITTGDQWVFIDEIVVNPRPR